MPQENSVISYLKEIKEKLLSQEMSVIVGAGFSKNVNNDLYPSWWQLLADMVRYMHGKKIEREYEHLKSSKRKEDKKAFTEGRINDFINEIGPLKVASRYMEAIGFRESIDTYIEERTPYIIIRDGKKYLRHFNTGKQEELLLTDADLSTHKKLVNLPWNNIYTTNYDNLLEKCVDENIETEIKAQIHNLQESLNELEKGKVQFINEIKKLEEGKLNSDVDQDQDRSQATGADIAVDSINYDDDEKKENDELRADVSKPDERTEQKIMRLKWEVEFAERQIKLKEKELSKLNLLLKECPSVVIRSSQLALKRTRNIIKLHGSRRTNENNTFGFDDDSRKQYVITQEDFDSYPVKHEAFTQLMRISLLQESFCLVGFSGVDPNFLAWIGWVRDVLFKDIEKRENTSNKKIYLISASNDTPDYAKETFYENQRIANIPLLDDLCIEFLERETGKRVTNRTSRKEVLNIFFEYLQTDALTLGPEMAIEISHRTKFNQLSESLPYWNEPITDENAKSTLEKLHQIEALLPYNRLPSLDYLYDSKRLSFLEQTSAYLEHTKENPALLQPLLAAISEFMRTQWYPHSVVYRKELIDFSELTKKAKTVSQVLYGKFLLLELKDAIWHDDKDRFDRVAAILNKIEDVAIDQETKYLMALYALLRLEFDILKQCLSLWEPVDHWVLKKAGLLSHFSSEDAASLLFKEDITIVQEYLYELEFNRYLSYSWLTFGDSPKNEQYKFLKSSGLNVLADSVDYLLDEIKEKEDKILPYGEGKFTISNNFLFTNSDKHLQSMQLVGLMLESGYPFATYNSNFRQPQKVYRALFNTMRYFWMPVVQSVLQFDDTKFIKRMSQDLVFNEEDVAVFRKIESYLYPAYFNETTPGRYKENIITFVTELLNVSEPQKWEPHFIRLWKENLSRLRQSERRGDRLDDYFGRALRLVQDVDTIVAILRDCLEASIEEAKPDTVIQYLYELANNPYLKLNSSIVRTSVNKQLLDLIARVTSQPKLLFAAGNLEALLTDPDKKLISEQLNEINFNQIDNVRLWRVMLFFVSGNVALLHQIKDAILNSRRLWDAGFTEKGVTRGEYIRLRRLRKNGDFPGLEWEPAEVTFIYNRLKAEYERIEAFVKKRPKTALFNEILEEMVVFLNDEVARLETFPDYESIKQSVNETLNGQRAFDSALKGVISEDQNKVLWALDEIVTVIQKYQEWLSWKIYMDVLVNKVLLQKQPAIEACLNSLSYLVYELKDREPIKLYKEPLLAILTQYSEYPLESGDKPYIEEQLVRIAFVLSVWGVDEKIVKTYLDLLDNSRFNNVRYSLKQRFLNDKQF